MDLLIFFFFHRKMKLRTFIVAALAFGLIFALFADAKSVKGKVIAHF